MEASEPSPKRRRVEDTTEQTQKPVVDTNYKLPEFLKNHFVYSGTLSSGPNRRNVLKCLHCQKELKAKASETFSFRRHLLAAHNIAVESKKEVPTTTLEHFILPKPSTTTTPIPKWFRQAVLDLISIDGLPLSILEGVGFQSFVAKLNQSVRCYSSTTVKRHLDEDFNKLVVPSLSKHIQDLPSRSIHLTLDLWTSRAKDSILGLNVNYISPSWKLHRRCLAFEAFPESHTGRNIETRVRSILQRRNIKTHQVGKVMVDNASNMIAAFNLTTVLSGNWNPGPLPIDDDDFYSEDEAEEDEDVSTNEENVPESPTIEFSWERLGCCAHSLQLCVRAAIEKDASAKHIIEQVNKVTLFFRRSAHLMHQLKEKTKLHRGLLLPGSTRWNSVFHAIKRILKADVFNAVLEILQSTPTSKNRTPPKFTESMKPQLEELVALLEPMNCATNRLQGNGITSSLVIPSLLETYIEIDKVKCTFFPVLRDVLLKQLKQRFGSTLREPTYIVSTILDPRMKCRIFNPSVSPSFPPVSEDSAMKIVGKFFDDARADTPAEEPTLEAADLNVAEGAARRKKPEKDLFSFLDSVAPMRPIQKTELELYVGEPAAAKECEPLQFWKENASRFPVLSSLAQVLLSVPASSGDVERLFSIAGSITRARRSTITPQRLEQLLLYRDYRLPIFNLK